MIGNIYLKSYNMGNKTSKKKFTNIFPESPLLLHQVPKVYNLFNIRCNIGYNTYSDIQDSLLKLGLEDLNLIFGIDYADTDNNPLHQIYEDGFNTYQNLIYIIGNILKPFNRDGRIYTYGFGHKTITNFPLFSFNLDEQPSYTIEGVLEKYCELTPIVEPKNKTNFSPIIDKAINIVRRTGKYHILIILTNSKMDSWDEINETFGSIIEASNYALSIILVGINNNTWDNIDKYDEQIPERRFNNFHFVNFNTVMHNYQNSQITGKWDIAIALYILSKIPEQYNAIKILGYLGKKYEIEENILVYPDFSIYKMEPNIPD